MRLFHWQAEAVLWETLGSILDVGLPPDRALNLAAQPAGGATARIARAAAVLVGQGTPLSEALRASGADPFACAVICAGETTGRLPPLLRRLGESCRLRAKLRNETIGRLIYPSILIQFALLVLPLPMVVASKVSPWMLLLGPVSLWVLVGIAVLLGLWFRRSGVLGRIALKKPCAAVVWPALIADLAAVLGAAFTSGMLASDALELAASACSNRLLAERLRTAAGDLRNRRLPDLASALASAGLSGDLLELFRTGEASGRLEYACDQVRTIASERFSWRLQWAGKIATGLCYGLAVLVAALTVISMFTQVYAGLNSELAEPG
jgi:type II secretory pathway component PulF